MTAYPVTCLIDYEDGYLTVITLEEPSDSDTEAGAIAKLRIKADDGKALQVGLSPEAAEVLERRLRELRGAPEVEAEHVAVSRGGSPATRDLSESVAHGPEDDPCATGRCGARISATHRCQLDYGHAGECAG